MNDTQLLDALERFIDNNGGLVIHHGGCDSVRYPGLGLRCTNRTLRKALHQALASSEVDREQGGSVSGAGE